MLHDAVRLSAADGDLASRLGRFDVLAVVVVAGERLAARGRARAGDGRRRVPVERRAAVVLSAAPLPGLALATPGCVVRLAGERVEDVRGVAARALDFVPGAARRRSLGPQMVMDDGDAMHLTPREIDKLVLHQAGVLAQKRLARGLRLNYPEAVALIATQLLEFIRDGRTGRRADGSRPAAPRPRRRDGRRAPR